LDIPPSEPADPLPTIIDQAATFGPVDGFFSLIGIFILLLGSALISASEVAFFSMKSGEFDSLQKGSPTTERIQKLLARPRQLLATLLIANNLFNISIVILSYQLFERLMPGETEGWVAFLLNSVVVTFLIVIFGESLPKVFANSNKSRVIQFAAIPIAVLDVLFRPISYLLVLGSRFFDRWMKKSKSGLSLEELGEAIDLTYEQRQDAPREKDMLKGIVAFGTLSARQIMVPRSDIKAVDIRQSFAKVREQVRDWGYSRVPVYKDSLDEVVGILYLKDLLPYHDRDDAPQWTNLLRTPFFVPEKKRIDDLFRDFQDRHMHLALVVDEFGGCSGLITLEDVLEQIVGEIHDEFDEAESSGIISINESAIRCDGQTLIQDLIRAGDGIFDDLREFQERADSVAGLILELAGKIPVAGEVVCCKSLLLEVLESDDRRIRKVEVRKMEDGTGPANPLRNE
jgi:gliding motility-associated protein GldE